MLLPVLLFALHCVPFMLGFALPHLLTPVSPDRCQVPQRCATAHIKVITAHLVFVHLNQHKHFLQCSDHISCVVQVAL